MSKPINVVDEDHQEYTQFAQELSDDLGIKISVPAMLRLAVKFYKQRRKLGETQDA